TERKMTFLVCSLPSGITLISRSRSASIRFSRQALAKRSASEHSTRADVVSAQRFFVFDDLDPALPGHLLHGSRRLALVVVRGVRPGVLSRNAVGEHQITRHI